LITEKHKKGKKFNLMRPISIFFTQFIFLKSNTPFYFSFFNYFRF